jgi:two-component system cell cycle sensor histidine kinase/response regulator CckA
VQNLPSRHAIALSLLLLQTGLTLSVALGLGFERWGLTLLAALSALAASATFVLVRHPSRDAHPPAQPREVEATGEAELAGAERLAGGLAHNFSNLLTVIGASTSLAEHAISSGKNPRAELEEINQAVARAAQLTKQLSAFARRRKPRKRELELNELVRELEPSLARLLGESSRLLLSLVDTQLHVLADQGQLEQVLIGVVLNARDAIADGGEVRVETRRASLATGQYACIEVRDNGSGMTKEVQRRLCEPFFTTKARDGGAGLGLTSSSQILQSHEGVLQIESEPLRGTLVRLLLPLREPAQRERRTTSGVVEIRPKPARVLVSDDEPQVRALAVRVLRAAGFEVIAAEDGAQALAVFEGRSSPIDVLVTDVVMPKLSGPALARTVRSYEPSLGLVFMSGYPEAMHDAAPDEFAGAAFLTKPFTPQALVSAVSERVGRRRAWLRNHG